MTHNRNIFRVLRQIEGLSLKDMATKCQISAVYLAELETGKKGNPSDDIINKIADGCGITPQTIRYFLTRPQGSVDFSKHLLASLDNLVIATVSNL